ncbi:hypothetical protein NF865_07635 [Thermococcus aggregans]|uniref:Uncharacterized protein n=1 Tax=Thermococcus aggregans TaxID=110163 RepID=A0A9E7SNV6_THEAG|nr:hypothetical protein [Thermococcus aggregans]USS40197.1 hypothetical protein NF865_07635 [Thermococcus aggregans]
MKIPWNALHLFALAFATAWELVLLYGLPERYYIDSGITHLENWSGKGRPYVCWHNYSPSLEFIILALVPAFVLLVLYLIFKNRSSGRRAFRLASPCSS